VTNNTLSNRPLVSVIIPCRNEREAIEHCVASALSQQPPEGGIEVLIADGMSDDGTREILRKAESSDPRIKLIDNPGRIASTGLNAAIHASSGGIIVRMDAHTEYSPDYVRRCVELLKMTGADNVGGPARTKPATWLERAIAAAYHSPFSVGGARFHDVDYEGFVDTVTYGCWRKESFGRFGMFDEELVRNQDDEHNLRIIRGGGRIWQSPRIMSWYRPRGSLSSLFKQYMQYGYWKVRVIQKHKLPASIRHLVPGVFLLTLSLLAMACLLSLLWRWAGGARPAAGGLVFGCSALALGFLLSVYGLCLLAVSLLTASGAGWRLFPLLPVVFPCYHFGYGYGFLRGAVDFVVLRNRDRGGFRSLTR
jgi:succinoglycan biosynthesis protein ExoA